MTPVVVTGLGAWTALGKGAEASFAALCEGRSGIAGDGPFPGRGPVAAIPGGPHLGSVLAEQVVREALGDLDPARMGLVGASTAGDMVRGEVEYAARLRGEPVTDGFLWAQLCDRPTQQVASALGFGGPRLTVSTACSSGAVAVGIAVDWVRSGRAEQVLAFGVDALCALTVHGFGSLGAISEHPARPFDPLRAGLSLGEGAGALLVESAAHAERRGARVFATLAGVGMSSDAHHMTAPDPTGAGAQRAIEQAGLDGVDWICAHGTATPLNDAMEAEVLSRVFPDVPVSSLKGAIGHTLGAAGAIELVAAVLAVHQGRIPPNVGGAGLLPVPQACVVGPLRGALSVNFAFGGHNTAVRVLR